MSIRSLVGRVSCLLTMLFLPVAAHALSPLSAVQQKRLDEAYENLHHAFETQSIDDFSKVWSEQLIVNAPNRKVLTREQIFGAVRAGFLRFNDATTVVESSGSFGGAIFVMGHEQQREMGGSNAGKVTTLRFTDVWMDDGGVLKLVARQATQVEAK